MVTEVRMTALSGQAWVGRGAFWGAELLCSLAWSSWWLHPQKYLASCALQVTLCRGLNFCVPPSSYVEIKVRVLGGGALGRWLSHEVEASRMGLYPHKRDPEGFLFLSALWAHSEETSIYSSEEGSQQSLVTLASSARTSSLYNFEK